jgi:hypothetical protein
MTIDDIKYTWQVDQFHVVPSKENQTDVVTKIAFTLHGEYIDKNGKSFKESWSGATVLDFDPDGTFTSLKDVNQQMAEQWIELSENKKQRNVNWLRNKVLSRLQEKVTPTLVVISPPFLQK